MQSHNRIYEKDNSRTVLRVSEHDVCPIVFPYVGQTHEGGELEPLLTGNSAFGTGRDFQRRKEGWKRERSSRLGWVKRPEIVPRSDISNPFLLHATNRGQPSTFTIFPIFFLFPVFLPFLTTLPSHTRTRRHFRKTSTAKRNLRRVSSELLLQNFRLHHEIRSEKSILLRNYDFEWIPRWLMFDGNNSFYSKLSTVLQAIGNTHYLIVSKV